MDEGELVLGIGTAVRRRGAGDWGVILGGAPTGWRVAFGRETVMLHPDDLELAPGSPGELLAAGHLGDSEEHLLRLRARYLQHAYRHDPFASLNNARIEPQMHQVFVAHRVSHKLRPRMILADEVGLGKTIEAGLIIKELRAREQIERVLIIAPASLTRQWQSELSTKFNEHFELIDGVAAAYLGKNGANPFLSRSNVICSLPFASGKKRAEQVLEGNWDMVVFDEAHRVRRTRQKETEAYKLADELKEITNGLLLLTATPVQLHQHELYSLVQLVEPGLFRNERAFDQQRLAIPQLNQLMQALDHWDALTMQQRTDVFDTHARRLALSGCASLDVLAEDGARASVIEQVIGQHPLADVMIRNRKSELGLAGRRRAITESVELTDLEREIYDDVTEYLREGYGRAKKNGATAVGFLMVTYLKMLTSSAQVLRVSFRRRIEGLRRQAAGPVRKPTVRSLADDYDDPQELSVAFEEAAAGAEVDRAAIEFEISELEGLAARLDQVRDSKMARAVQMCLDVLADDETAKIVVFTQFIETQRIFAEVLKVNGVASVVFNGNLDADAKERAIRDFRERAQVLVSTEAGGEGRNLQFAHHLVNYDLPWNPMKIEQRIGRLDRIGQRRTVEIHNLVAAGTLEERILKVLAERIRLFEESVGALDPILGGFEKDIERLALDVEADRPDAFTMFSQDIEQQVLQARATEKALDNFVLDRASFRRDQLNELQQRPAMANQEDVADLCRDALAREGGMLAEHEDGGEMVRLSTRTASRLGLRQQGYHGVFSAQEALRRDELDFFAFGHELVDSLVAACAQRDGAEVGGRRSGDCPPGTWVEIVYETRSDVGECRGALVRHLVGPDLDVTSSRLVQMPDDLPAKVEVPTWAADAVARSQACFEREFGDIRAGYLQEFEDVRAAMLNRASRLYDYRRDRLQLQVGQAKEWLAEREIQATDKDRKILPARRGKLQKDLARLASLLEDYQQEQESIRERTPNVDGAVAWASVVVGM